METTDGQLIRRFQGGERGAFTTLVERWESKVFALAYRLTGHLQDAEDIRQQAFLRSYQSLVSFAGDANFSTWLYRIVVNLARDGARSRASRERTLVRAAYAGTAARAEDSPEVREEQRETAQRVADALRALPPAQREVLILRHFHEIPFPRVAEILDEPVTTVKSRALQGLKRLRQSLIGQSGSTSEGAP